MYYRKEMIATHNESDSGKRLKVSGMLRCMQQTSNEQLGEMGQSNEGLGSHNMVFMLAKTNVKIHRAPTSGERISVGTSAPGPKGVKFLREFVIDTPGGERLVSCLTIWVLVDTQNHKILRPNVYPYAYIWDEPTLEGVVDDIVIPRQTPPGAQVLTSRREIYYSHIDINNHVNNSMYADFACDALPYDLLASRGISQMAINFQKEARHSDVIDICTVRLGDGEYKITGTNAGAPCFEAYAALG